MFKHIKSVDQLRAAQSEVRRLRAVVGETAPVEVEEGDLEAQESYAPETVLERLEKNDPLVDYVLELDMRIILMEFGL